MAILDVSSTFPISKTVILNNHHMRSVKLVQLFTRYKNEYVTQLMTHTFRWHRYDGAIITQQGGNAFSLVTNKSSACNDV